MSTVPRMYMYWFPLLIAVKHLFFHQTWVCSINVCIYLSCVICHSKIHFSLDGLTQFSFQIPFRQLLNDDENDLQFIDIWKLKNIAIKHALSSKLKDVGLQVWPAALFLCEAVITWHKILRGAVVLDLGSGTGITSIITSYFSRTVYATGFFLP